MADAAELKMLRKAAKKAAAALAAAEEAESDAAELKSLRKAAKKAAAAAAAAEEPEEEDDPDPEEEARRKRKEAKRAAKAAAAEADADEVEAPVQKKKRKQTKDEDEVDVEAEATVQKKKKKKNNEEDEEEDEEDARGTKKKKKVAESNNKAVEVNPDNPNPFRMFVGGIAWHVEEEQLRKDFSECGEVVDLKLLMDNDTGKSRGIAFITMADQAGFDAAFKFDGTEYAGRPLNVSKANSTGGNPKGKGKGKDGKGKDGKGKGKGPGEKPAGCTSVVVKGLAYEATEEDLREVFGKCKGGPTNVNLLWDDEIGKSKGVAFIDFDDTDAVDEAMKLTETFLKGRSFFLRYSERQW